MVQSDPHFGNYRFRPGARAQDDRIVLLDFGATRVFGRGFIENYADIVEGSLCRDREQVTRGAKARSEEHTSELQSLMRISYAVFCLKKKNKMNQSKNQTSK